MLAYLEISTLTKFVQTRFYNKLMSHNDLLAEQSATNNEQQHKFLYYLLLKREL